MMRKICVFGLISSIFAFFTGVACGGEELLFAAQEGAPVPEIGVLTATNSVEWDMVSRGIDEIGVRFKADDVLPSSAVIRWKGGEHYYFQRLDLSGATVGDWVDCSFSLEGLEDGGWGGGGRSEEDFEQDLRQFQEVEVQVCRRGMGEQRYEVEGFYRAKDGEVVTRDVFTVSFVWHGGSSDAECEYGVVPEEPDVPEAGRRYVENGVIHTFAGWSPAVAAVTDDATYTATYDEAAVIAQIVGGEVYPSLAEAVAAAADGATVVLLADQTLDARVEPNLGADTTLVIDLNGKTLARAGTSGNGSVFDVKSGNVVITNGVIDCTQDDTAIVADGVYAITVRGGANVTLADLEITVDSKNGACVYPFAGATLAIESGTYANITAQPYDHKAGWMGMAVNQANVAETLITITGGSFSQVDPALGDDSAAEGTMSFVDDDYVTVLEDGAYVVYEAVTVTFVTDKGDVPEAQRIGKGKTATEPDPAPECENWAFNSWTLEGAEYDFSSAVMEDIELVADWTLTHQTVTFDPSPYGTFRGEPTLEMTFEIGGTYHDLPGTTPDGTHARIGWYTMPDGEGGEPVADGDAVTGGATLTLYAHWTDKQTVTFDAQNETVPSTKVYTVGGRYGTLPKPTWAGHAFLGWYTAAEGGKHLSATSIVTTRPTRTMYAHWTTEQTVIFDAQGGACEPATMIAEMGGRYGALPKPTKAGYAFVGWYTKAEGGNHLTANSIVTTLNTRTFYAHWTTEQTVTFDAQGGTCDPGTMVATVGEAYGALPVPEKEGQKFLGWYTKAEGGSKVSAASVVTAVTKRTLYAHWKESAGTLSISGFSRSVRAGTLARDAKFDADEYTLSFETEAGVTYEVQWTAELGGEWTTLKSWTAEEDGEMAVTVTVPAGANTGFFRLVAQEAE